MHRLDYYIPPGCPVIRKSGVQILVAGLPGENHEIGLLLFSLAAHESGFRVISLGANMPLTELAKVARQKKCMAIVISGAIEPSQATLRIDIPELVKSSDVPVMVGGLSSVYSCDAINKAGAEALGRDIEHGLKRMAEILA
jgi:cobalamin-dependent methionine synthase I